MNSLVIVFFIVNSVGVLFCILLIQIANTTHYLFYYFTILLPVFSLPGLAISMTMIVTSVLVSFVQHDCCCAIEDAEDLRLSFDALACSAQ